MRTKEKARAVADALAARYPEAECGLQHGQSAFRLFVMAVLSAQCTDKRVCEVSVPLFQHFPDAFSLASADLAELESIIRPVGLYHSKAKNLIAACVILRDSYGGVIPSGMDELLALPGVGRKIANLLRGDLFGLGGIVADTHCIRISNRLGLASGNDQLKTEKALSALIPLSEQSEFCHRLVVFGREVCIARSPRCDSCELSALCEHHSAK